MRGFLVFLLIVIVGVGILGYAMGWYTVSTRTEDGKPSLTVSVEKDKWIHDRDAAYDKVKQEMKEIDQEIDSLKAKAKAPETNEETRKEIDTEVVKAEERRKDMDHELDQLKTSTKEEWQIVHGKLSTAYDDVKAGLARAISRFRAPTSTSNTPAKTE